MSGGAPPTLVKVGSGDYLEWSGEDLSGLSAGRLLKALKHDELFENDLRDAPLGRCKVFVLPTLDTEPAEAYQLALFATVKDLAGASPAKLFIRVELPAPAAAGGAGEVSMFSSLPDGRLRPEASRKLRSAVIGISDSSGTTTCSAVFFSPTHALTAYHDASPSVGDKLCGHATPSRFYPEGQAWEFIVVATSKDDDVVVLKRSKGPTPTEVLPLLSDGTIDDYLYCKIVVATFGLHAASHGGDEAGSIDIGTCAEWTSISASGKRHFAYAGNNGRGDSGGAVLDLSGNLVGLHLGGWNGADSPPGSPQKDPSTEASASADAERERRKNEQRLDSMGLADATSQVVQSVTNLTHSITTGGFALFLTAAIVDKIVASAGPTAAASASGAGTGIGDIGGSSRKRKL